MKATFKTKYNKQRFVWGNEIKLQVKTLYIQSAGVVLLDGDEIRFEVNKKCCFVFQNNCLQNIVILKMETYSITKRDYTVNCWKDP